MSAQPAHQRLRAWAIGILLAGLAAGSLIYVFAPGDARDSFAEIARDPGYEYSIERIGGKGMVYAARFNAWFASLWHGRTLGVTIGVLAIVCALALLKVAQGMRRAQQAARSGIAARDPGHPGA